MPAVWSGIRRKRLGERISMSAYQNVLILIGHTIPHLRAIVLFTFCAKSEEDEPWTFPAA